MWVMMIKSLRQYSRSFSNLKFWKSPMPNRLEVCYKFRMTKYYFQFSLLCHIRCFLVEPFHGFEMSSHSEMSSLSCMSTFWGFICQHCWEVNKCLLSESMVWYKEQEFQWTDCSLIIRILEYKYQCSLLEKYWDSVCSSVRQGTTENIWP